MATEEWRVFFKLVITASNPKLYLVFTILTSNPVIIFRTATIAYISLSVLPGIGISGLTGITLGGHFRGEGEKNKSSRERNCRRLNKVPQFTKEKESVLKKVIRAFHLTSELSETAKLFNIGVRELAETYVWRGGTIDTTNGVFHEKGSDEKIVKFERQ